MEATITPAEFERLRHLARGHFGLDLRPGKEPLVQARLRKRLAQLGCRHYSEYIDRVVADRSGSELASLVDALTTNFTNFFREPEHFDFLERSILPSLRERAELRVWCAGCATGEEAYSILFTLIEAAPAQRPAVLATDISIRALAAAEAGIFPEQRIAGFPARWQSKYWQRGDGAWRNCFRVKPEIRSAIQFRRLNLVEPFDHLPRFPVIFCRNVMIYFDRATQTALVKRFADRLEPGGYLLVGHSEGLFNSQVDLEYVCPATYRKPGASN